MNEYNEFFTTRAPSSFGVPLIRWWHQRMLRLARNFIPDLDRKNILEIGSGMGFIAELCKKMGIVYSGHEMNTTQSLYLQSLGYDVSAATIPPIPAGKTADVIWLSHVLEHAKDFQEAKGMLKACHERLTKNGYVVVIAPDIHHWKNHFWNVDWSHGFPTTLNRVEQLLNETGFTVHHATHHAFTLTQPFLAWVISSISQLLPATLIDMVLFKMTNRKFCHSFLYLLGLRQIFLIGKK